MLSKERHQTVTGPRSRWVAISDFLICVPGLAQEPSDGGSVRGNASGSFQCSCRLWQVDIAILRYQPFPETLTGINNVAPIAEEGLKQIKIFYYIVAQIEDPSADERRTIRQKKTLPRTAMADLKPCAGLC